ncbi:glycoside hydrolase [Microbacterium sp. K24]|uniref:RICIN domain-containing protein n=1 Tax=Microbacterium sp. K24 TaxID=2305446 RepID=UPI00109C04A9|nr:glycoside hydrolase [Microbacterium sp. K24]
MSERRTTRHRRALALAAVLAATATGLTAVPQAATAAGSDLTLTPNPAYAGESFRGWGSSLVWMANATGSYPADLRDELIDKVFGDDGLNLNIARYNIGGGNASDVPDYLRPGGAVPGWWNPEAPLTDENGAISSDFADRDRFRAAWTGENASDYDFSADAAQLAWVSAIKDEVDTWEAFSNSPPYFLTESGFVSGGTDAWADQIRRDSLGAFATYLKTVVEHVEDTQGISFDTIDPLNEPNTNYWGTTLGDDGWPTSASRQEGAHAGPALQAEVIKALAAELAESGTTTDAAISGPDETNPDRFVEDWNGWDGEARDAVSQLNVHTYGTGGRPLVRDIAKSADKPLWMSEVEGNWGGDSWNPDAIENGLGIAQLVSDDLRELEPEAWVLWQPVEDLYNMEKVEKKNWGSIFIDFDCDANGDSARRIADGDADPSCQLRTNAKYNTLRNFTHYIEPGDQLIRVGDDDTTAAIDGDGSGATLVHTNESDQARTITIDLSLFGEVDAGATVTPIVTTESPASDPEANALRAGTAVSVGADGAATLTVPAKSVTTFVISGVGGVAAEAPALRDGASYTLTGAQSGHALTVVDDSTQLGSAREPALIEAQTWTASLIDDQPGTTRDRFALRAADGRALVADGDGTALQTLDDAAASADPSALWMMTSTNGTTFSLLNAGRGKVLDVAGASTSTGASVGVWQSNGGANQQWRLDPAREDIAPYASFRPGQEWLDTDGEVIQAHGGQVVPSKDDDGRTIYYLYGEDRTNGYHSAPGVHVYSSYDLYNWEDRGVALRTLASTEDFDDPYFEALYGDYSQEQKDAVYRDLGTVPVEGVTPPIIERPKVIYNEKTGKWVMWAHMDGPSATSSAQYAKANAGVAVADSPFGPFRYIDSYRLNSAPADADPVNNAPNNPGMARDMNLFVDDDGTGYIIYSSEENATMFISKLNEEYTDLATPADEAVLGVDYNRIFVNQSRESPAIFQHDERYFLITSGTTGWSPNPAQWATSTDLMGAWTEMGDPFPWWAQSNSWNSQPSSVIPVDPDQGKYIYMGDRWNGGTDLKNAQMVWLPISMGEGGDSLSVEVYDEWTLDQLDQWSAWEVSAVPETVPVGGDFDVPVVNVTRNGVATEQPVTWSFSGSFDAPGIVTATGTLPEFGGRTFTRTIAVVPEGIRYAVNAGGQQTSDWLALKDAVADGDLQNSRADQPYGEDADTGASWGYVSEGSKTSGATDGTMFSTLRYAVEQRDIAYRFGDLEPGRYSVHVGYADPWDQWDDRGAQVSVNGAVVEEDHDYTAADETRSYADISVGDAGEIELVLHPTRDADVQVSWIMVTLDEPTTPAAPEITISSDAVTAGDRITVEVAGLEPEEDVSFALHSDPVDMGTVTADGAGAASLTWRVPTSVPAGAHHVVMTRADGSEFRAALTVRAAQPGTGQPGAGGVVGGASGGALASTGLDGGALSAMLALAALLLVGGGLAFAGRRRWRR